MDIGCLPQDSLPPRVTGPVSGELILTLASMIQSKQDYSSGSSARRRPSLQGLAHVVMYPLWWGQEHPSAIGATADILQGAPTQTFEEQLRRQIEALCMVRHSSQIQGDHLLVSTVRAEQGKFQAYLRDSAMVNVLVCRPSVATAVKDAGRSRAPSNVTRTTPGGSLLGMARIPLADLLASWDPSSAVASCTGRAPVHTLVRDSDLAWVPRKGGQVPPGALGPVIGTVTYGLVVRMRPMPLLSELPPAPAASPPPVLLGTPEGRAGTGTGTGHMVDMGTSPLGTSPGSPPKLAAGHAEVTAGHGDESSPQPNRALHERWAVSPPSPAPAPAPPQVTSTDIGALLMAEVLDGQGADETDGADHVPQHTGQRSPAVQAGTDAGTEQPSTCSEPQVQQASTTWASASMDVTMPLAVEQSSYGAQVPLPSGHGAASAQPVPHALSLSMLDASGAGLGLMDVTQHVHHTAEASGRDAAPDAVMQGLQREPSPARVGPRAQAMSPEQPHSGSSSPAAGPAPRAVGGTVLRTSPIPEASDIWSTAGQAQAAGRGEAPASTSPGQGQGQAQTAHAGTAARSPGTAFAATDGAAGFYGRPASPGDNEQWLAGIPRPAFGLSGLSPGPGLTRALDGTVASLAVSSVLQVAQQATTAGGLASSSTAPAVPLPPEVAELLARSGAVLASIDQALGAQTVTKGSTTGARDTMPGQALPYGDMSLGRGAAVAPTLQSVLTAAGNVWDRPDETARANAGAVGTAVSLVPQARPAGDLWPIKAPVPSHGLVPSGAAVDEAYLAVRQAVEELLVPLDSRGGADGQVAVPADPVSSLLVEASRDHQRLKAALDTAQSALRLPGLVSLGDRLLSLAERIQGLRMQVTGAVVHPAAAVAAAHESSGRLGGMALLAVEDAKARAAAERATGKGTGSRDGTPVKGGAEEAGQGGTSLRTDTVRPPRVLPKQSLSALRDWCSTGRWTVEYVLPPTRTATRGSGNDAEAMLTAPPQGSSALVVAFSTVPEQPRPDVVTRLTKGTGITGIGGSQAVPTGAGAGPVTPAKGAGPKDAAKKGVKAQAAGQAAPAPAASSSPAPPSPAHSAAPPAPSSQTTASLLLAALPSAPFNVPIGSTHDWEPAVAVPLPLAHVREEPLAFDHWGLSTWLGAARQDGDREGQQGDVGLQAEIRLYVEPPTGTAGAGQGRILVGRAHVPLRLLLLSESLALDTTVDLTHAYRRGGSRAGSAKGTPDKMAGAGTFTTPEPSSAADGRRQAFLASLHLDGEARERVEKALTLRQGLAGHDGASGAAAVPSEPQALPALPDILETVARVRLSLQLQVKPEAPRAPAPPAVVDVLQELRTLPLRMREDAVEADQGPVDGMDRTILASTLRSAVPARGVPSSWPSPLPAALPPSMSLGDATATRLAHVLATAAHRPASAAPCLLLCLHEVRDVHPGRPGRAVLVGLEARVRPPRTLLTPARDTALEVTAVTLDLFGPSSPSCRHRLSRGVCLPLRVPGSGLEAEVMALALAGAGRDKGDDKARPAIVIEVWGKTVQTGSPVGPSSLLGVCHVPVDTVGEALLMALGSGHAGFVEHDRWQAADIRQTGASTVNPEGRLLHGVAVGSTASVSVLASRMAAARVIQRAWAGPGGFLQKRAARERVKRLAEAKAAEVLAAKPAATPTGPPSPAKPPAAVAVPSPRGMQPPREDATAAQVEAQPLDLPALQVQLWSSENSRHGSTLPSALRHQFHVYLPGRAPADLTEASPHHPGGGEAGLFLDYTFPRQAVVPSRNAKGQPQQVARANTLWWSAVDPSRSTTAVHSLPLPLAADVRDALPADTAVGGEAGLVMHVSACRDRDHVSEQRRAVGSIVISEASLRALVERAWQDAQVRAQLPDPAGTWGLQTIAPQWHEAFTTQLQGPSYASSTPLQVVIAYRAVPVIDNTTGSGAVDTSTGRALAAVQAGAAARTAEQARQAHAAARAVDDESLTHQSALATSMDGLGLGLGLPAMDLTTGIVEVEEEEEEDESGQSPAGTALLSTSAGLPRTSGTGLDLSTSVVDNGSLGLAQDSSRSGQAILQPLESVEGWSTEHLLGGAEAALRGALASLAGAGPADGAPLSTPSATIAGVAAAAAAADIGIALLHAEDEGPATNASLLPLPRSGAAPMATPSSGPVAALATAPAVPAHDAGEAATWRQWASTSTTIEGSMSAAKAVEGGLAPRPVSSPMTAAVSSATPLSTLVCTAPVTVRLDTLADIRADRARAAGIDSPSAMLYWTYTWPAPPPSVAVTSHAMPWDRRVANADGTASIAFDHSHTLKVPAAPGYWAGLLARGVCIRIELRVHSPAESMSPLLLGALSTLTTDPKRDPVVGVASIPLMPLTTAMLGGRIDGWYLVHAPRADAGKDTVLGAVKVQVEAQGVPQEAGLAGQAGHASTSGSETMAAAVTTAAGHARTHDIISVPMPSSFAHTELKDVVQGLDGMLARLQAKGQQGRDGPVVDKPVMQGTESGPISPSLLLSADDHEQGAFPVSTELEPVPAEQPDSVAAPAAPADTTWAAVPSQDGPIVTAPSALPADEALPSDDEADQLLQGLGLGTVQDTLAVGATGPITAIGPGPTDDVDDVLAALLPVGGGGTALGAAAEAEAGVEAGAEAGAEVEGEQPSDSSTALSSSDRSSAASTAVDDSDQEDEEEESDDSESDTSSVPPPAPGQAPAQAVPDVQAVARPVVEAEQDDDAAFYEGLGFGPGELDTILAALRAESGIEPVMVTSPARRAQAQASEEVAHEPAAAATVTVGHAPAATVAETTAQAPVQPLLQGDGIRDAVDAAAGPEEQQIDTAAQQHAPAPSATVPEASQPGVEAPEAITQRIVQEGSPGEVHHSSVSPVPEVESQVEAQVGHEADGPAPEASQPATVPAEPPQPAPAPAPADVQTQPSAVPDVVQQQPPRPSQVQGAPMQLVPVTLPGLGLVYLPVVLPGQAGPGQASMAAVPSVSFAVPPVPAPAVAPSAPSTPSRPMPVPVPASPSLAQLGHMEEVYGRLRAKLGLSPAREQGQAQDTTGKGNTVVEPTALSPSGGSPPLAVTASGVSPALQPPAMAAISTASLVRTSNTSGRSSLTSSPAGPGAAGRPRPAPRAFPAHDPARFAALLRGAASGSVGGGLTPDHGRSGRSSIVSSPGQPR